MGDLAGGDDDIVVDTLEGGGGTTSAGEFEISPGKILGLDQAVLQSIERCCEYLNAVSKSFIVSKHTASDWFTISCSF